MAARTYPEKKILVHARMHRDLRPRKRMIPPHPRVARTSPVQIQRIRLARPLIKGTVLPSRARSHASIAPRVDMLLQHATPTRGPRSSATPAVALGILRALSRLVLRRKQRRRIPTLPAQSRFPARALDSWSHKLRSTKCVLQTRSLTQAQRCRCLAPLCTRDCPTRPRYSRSCAPLLKSSALEAHAL